MASAPEAAKTKWLGGYVDHSSGKPIYYIRKQVRGRRHHVSTRCHTERGALVELAAFEKDPANYSPLGTPGPNALFLDKDLARDFLAWSKTDKRNTPEWVTKQRGYLAWWADELHGVDLRGAPIAKILEALDMPRGAKKVRIGSRQHRIAVIKSLYAWLREVRRVISAQEDPTFGQLKVPQSTPEQWRRVKAVPADVLEKVRGFLEGHWRDALTVLMGTGWHVTELIRFTRSGSVIDKRGAKGVAGVLYNPVQKSGEPQNTPVTLDVLEAGRRLRARGGLSRAWFYRAIQLACVEAEVKPFSPGVLRHSVATHALDGGAAAAEVSTFLNQKAPSTMRRFYATHAVPGKVPTVV